MHFHFPISKIRKAFLIRKTEKLSRFRMLSNKGMFAESHQHPAVSIDYLGSEDRKY
jgi:hypothetical protein